MGGLFGFFDYNKAGPGVNKGEEKPRYVIFFRVLVNKFWKLIELNMLYIIFNIPSIIFLFYCMNNIFPNMLSGSGTGALDILLFGMMFMCVPVLAVGPAAAGFNYCLRNFSNEDHAWVWSDFKEHAFKNFKQSSIVAIIDLVVCILFSISFNIYGVLEAKGIIYFFLKCIMVVCFVVFTMMHMYIYPMMVTYKLSIKHIYKNALIFTMLKFFPTIGIALLCMAYIYLSMLFPVVGLILYVFLSFSVIGLLTNFYVNPLMSKYMDDARQKAETENAAVDGEIAENTENAENTSDGDN